MNFLELHMHQLRSFMTVAESRSFTAAAEKLFISHTALIQQMNSLERSLGFRVFDRSSRGIVLTDNGRFFYDTLRKQTAKLDGAIEQCRQRSETESKVRVANINDLHTFYFYSDFYRQFGRDHPDIEVDFVPVAGGDQLEMCRDGRIDIGFYFGMGKPAENKELVFRASMIASMCVLASKDDPLAQKESLYVEDLAGRIVFASNISSDALIYNQVSAIDYGQLQLTDLTMQRVYEYCKNGYLFLLPTWFSQHFPHLKPVPFSPAVEFTYYVVYRKEHTPAVKTLVNAYLDYDSTL